MFFSPRRSRRALAAVLATFCFLLITTDVHAQMGFQGISGAGGRSGAMGSGPGIGGQPGAGGQFGSPPAGFGGQPGAGGQFGSPPAGFAGPPNFGGQFGGSPAPGPGNRPGFGGGGITGMPPTTGSIQIKEWRCEKCNAVVGTGDTPPSLTKCPHCGVRIDHSRDVDGTVRDINTSSSGSDSSSGKTIAIIVGTIVGLSVLAGAIVAIVAASKKKPVRKRKRRVDYDDEDDYSRRRRQW